MFCFSTEIIYNDVKGGTKMGDTLIYRFQDVLEIIETWPLKDQSLLIEIMQRRLVQKRREELALEIKEARADYQAGDVKRGSVMDLMAELEDCCATLKR